MQARERRVVWLEERIHTPPFSLFARVEIGVLLRCLQGGESLGMPHSRPMPSIGPRVHELRVRDVDVSWRIIYRLDPDAIIVGAVFAKKTERTPQSVIDRCRRRFRAYTRMMEE